MLFWNKENGTASEALVVVVAAAVAGGGASGFLRLTPERVRMRKVSLLVFGLACWRARRFGFGG